MTSEPKSKVNRPILRPSLNKVKSEPPLLELTNIISKTHMETDEVVLRLSEPEYRAPRPVSQTYEPESEPTLPTLNKPQTLSQICRYILSSYIDLQQVRVGVEQRMRFFVNDLLLSQGCAKKVERINKFGRKEVDVEILPDMQDKAIEVENYLKVNSREYRIMLEHLKRLEKEENQILKEAKGLFENHSLFKWSDNVKGFSTVSCLTMLGLIEPNFCTSVGKVWRYLGLTPDCRKVKGQVANWNAHLKGRVYQTMLSVLMAKDAYYKELYRIKKEYYAKRSDLAQNTKKGKKGHVDAMAKRWLCKLLISHAWEIIRNDAGLSINKHHGHIPPKPVSESEQQEIIARFEVMINGNEPFMIAKSHSTASSELMSGGSHLFFRI